MPEGFDKTLFDLAEEANREVDFDALKQRVLDANAHSDAQETEEPRVKLLRPSAHRLRAWGLLAACLLLFVAAGTIALRGGAPKAVAEPQSDAASGAPLETQTESAYDMPMLAMAAPTAAEEPAPLPAPAAAKESFDEDAAPEAALTGRAGNAQSDDPFAVLVNRDHPLTGTEEPANLVSVDAAALPNVTLKKDGMRAEATALEAFRELLSAAETDGVTGFYLASVYRSYDEQANIWARKLEKEPDYGENGKPVSSMPPGESEHQTGLAFDVTCLQHPSLSAGFADTKQALWLRENCAKYGFILRYPKGKEDVTGVVFEPWHFRYVGIDLATYLTDNGLVLEEA